MRFEAADPTRPVTPRCQQRTPASQALSASPQAAGLAAWSRAQPREEVGGCPGESAFT